MRLLLSIHAVVTCYFMLAPITVDGRHSPPPGTTANFIRLHQSTAIVVSLSLLLAPVAVDAGYEDCMPTGIRLNENVFELTPTKEGVNALFSVGTDEPLVRTADEYTGGAVEVRVFRSSDSSSSDDDCYLRLNAGGGSEFAATRKCSSSEPEAKPAERTKEPTDLERSEKSKNRNAETAEPPPN